MDKIILIGGGGHAKVLASILRRQDAFEILGYTDLLDRGTLLGYPYLGPDQIIGSLSASLGKHSKSLRAVFGIGSVDVTPKRKQLFEQLKRTPLNFSPLISPDACISSDVSLGNGTVVIQGAIVQAGTRIGEAVILNTHCSIDHDNTIGDFTHIAPGATLCGGVNVGQNCFIGAGAVLNPGVKIGSNVLIGSGSVVISDCEAEGLYLGTPAKWIKSL